MAIDGGELRGDQWWRDLVSSQKTANDIVKSCHSQNISDGGLQMVGVESVAQCDCPSSGIIKETVNIGIPASDNDNAQL